MFGSNKICPQCGKKTSKKHYFCPFCGYSFREKENFFEPSFRIGFPFNTIFKQLEKQIEKQFRELDEQMPTFAEEEKKPKVMTEGISISISSVNGQPIIKVRTIGDKKEIRKENEKEAIKEGFQKKNLSEKQLEKLSKLPKEEPSTSVRRLADRIIYEIDMPGVEKENIIISRLQNSIEIKAFTKDKAFFKLIPISLPILKSHLKDGKLILELKPEQ
ncbi:MAG: hypothetical protein QW041_01915 [Candidatus Pacearchaeota archaeon]